VTNPSNPDNSHGTSGTGDETRTSGRDRPEGATHTSSDTPADPHQAGDTWGHLRIVDKLGAGAYGHVYRAWDATLAREVALKIIRIDRSDPVTAASVLREGQMLARVRHRNVVTVYGAQQIGGEFGFWMELIRGRPLTQMIREGGPLAAEEAALVGISICDALAAVHAAGLLHRDVKAQNVMRESGGRIVLMDFGAGRELVSGEPQRKEVAGTPVYMSPHVLAGGAWTASSDIYSVGVLLFFLVTGRYPVEGRTISDIALGHALGQQQMLPDLRPGLPDSFVRVVQRALESRYQTAGAMMRDLAEATPHAAAGVDLRERSGRPGAAQEPRSDAAWQLPQPAPADPGLRLLTAAAGGLLAVWLVGFITSKAFDQTLERLNGFSDDSPLDWLVFGVQSLIGPLAFMAAAVLLFHLLRLIWRGARRIIRPVRRASAWIAAGADRLRTAFGLDSRTTPAQWLLGIQVTAVGAVCWVFSDFIWAFTRFLNTAPREALVQLSPENNAQLAFRVVLSIVVLVSAVGWFALLRPDPERSRVDRTTTAAGLALIAASLGLLCAPYRLVHHSDFRSAQFEGHRCYITGQRGDDRLVFCPDTVPRNHIVAADDPRLIVMTTVENIFSRVQRDPP
jgi:serine/threonine-protein kinase